MVRIPSEYQEVEYLESTGGQWIDTNYLVQSENIRIVASINCAAPNGEQDLIGNQDSATGRFVLGFYRYYMFLFAKDSQKSELNVASRTFSSERTNFIIDAIYDLQNETKTLIVNGETYSGSHKASIISTATLKLFQNGNNMYRFIGKTRSLKLYEDDTLAFDFVPCYRKSDGEPGMYDIVSGTFFTNSGTGTFLVGNDVEYSTVSLLEARRKILLNTPHLTSASGSLATFNTDLSAPLKEMKVHFSPVQASGTPSPDNVLPISGWDGVTVYNGQTVVASITFPQTIYGGYVDLVKGEVVEEYAAVTLDGSFSPGIFPWQSEISEKDTGEILVKALYLKRDTYDNKHYRNAYLTAKCDKLVCTSNYNIVKRGCSFYDGSSYSICLTLPKSMIGTTIEELNTYLNNNPINTVFERQTPKTYPLTPQTLKTLKGINNIFSDANGNVDVTYWTH